MFSPTWIVLFFLFLISFVGIVLSALIFTKPVDDKKVSFMRIFPFEVIRTAENNAKYYTFSTYLFAGICFSPLLIITERTTVLDSLNPLTIMTICVLGLASLCFVLLNVFDVTHTKAHLALFVIYVSLTFLGGAMTFVRGLTAYTTFLKHGEQEVLLLISEIIQGLNLCFALILALNPKLLTWPRLDFVDGQYVRPKKFPLAYSEWGFLIVLFLSELMIFVQLLVK